MPTDRVILSSIEGECRRYKDLAEKALAQATDGELLLVPSPEGNSLAMVARHLSGNLTSRFTDFLTSDGEKPWRDRESEFAPGDVTRVEMMARWDKGWSILFAALADLDDASLGQRVTIRGQELSVLEALHRALAHASYHVGQIVLLAKAFRGGGWRSLSIPRGGTRA